MPPFYVTADWLVQAARVWKTRPVCEICGGALHVGEVVRWKRRRCGVNSFPERLQVRHLVCEAAPVAEKGGEARCDASSAAG